MFSHSGIVIVACKLDSSVAQRPHSSSVHLRVEFVLKYVQVVGGSYSDDVLVGVPGRVQDLFGKVQAVHADVVFPPLPTGRAHSPRFEDGPGFAALPRCLQRHVALGVAVEHAEEVVVGSRHDHTV